MGNYITPNELRSLKIKGVPLEFEEYSDSELEQEIRTAEAAIEKITGTIFYARIETNKFDGSNGTKQFFLPRIGYQLLDSFSVSDVDINGDVFDSYTENQDFVASPYYIEVGRWYPGDSPRRAFGRGGVWPSGQGNIQISGVWGYQPAKPGMGTVQIVTGELNTVVGTGTNFCVDFRPNALILIEGDYYTISSVTDDKHLIIVEDFEGTLDTDLVYSFFEIPPEIKKVTKLLAAEYVSSGITNMTAGNVEEINWPDFTVRFRDQGINNDFGTGFSLIDRILTNYVSMAPMFLVTD